MPAAARPTVVLSYGLGVDSTAILLRWLTDPSSRSFDLDQLVVITAMTGDEWPGIGPLVTEHVLPRLRAAGVRYVQVARAAASQTAGVVTLSDSTSPDTLHLAGAYRLSDELLAAGTVPQVGGARKCSAKAKGWPLDVTIAQLTGGHAYRHVIGFEANEPGRAIRDAGYNTDTRRGEYPLIEWGWDRATAEAFITAQTGVAWPKSACVYCPFALANRAGRERVLTDYRATPAAAVDALWIEHLSVALNPVQSLAPTQGGLAGLLAADGQTDTLDALEDRLDAAPFAVYEVRRVIRPRADDPTRQANASRSVAAVFHGTRAAALAQLAQLAADAGADLDLSDGIPRVWLRRRGDTLPAVEHLLVIAPEGIADKKLAAFDAWWAAAVAQVDAIAA